MTNKMKIIALILLSIIPLVTFGDNSLTDTTIYAETAKLGVGTQEYDDTFFKAGFATMTIIFLIAFCILTIIGVGIATIVLLAILGFGFAGIISTSVIYGLYKKSLEKTFKVFMILGFGFIGLVFCSVTFPFFNKIQHWTKFENALLIGIIFGLLSGLMTGLSVFGILKVLTRKYIGRLNQKQRLD